MRLLKVKAEILPKGIISFIKQRFCRHEEMQVKFSKYYFEAKCSKCNKHIFETKE